MPFTTPTTSKESIGRTATWFARVGAVFLSALTIVGLTLTAYGLYTGAIIEAGKYGSEFVSRSAEPFRYWYAVVYHTAVAFGMAYLAYVCARTAGWVARQRAVDTIAENIGTFLNPQRRASPFVIVVVLGAFFLCLAYIALR